MNVRTVEIEPARVACLRHTGPFGPALGEFWRDVVAPWMEANGLMGRVTYGVAMDDPGNTPPEKCRYDACVEVGHDDPAPPPAALATIPGGRYAVADYYGPAAGIGEAWQAFYSRGLAEAGLKDRPGPCFERYAADFRADPQTGEFACELFIPIN
jgi:DNA gyrase inhibitor GyrI